MKKPKNKTQTKQEQKEWRKIDWLNYGKAIGKSEQKKKIDKIIKWLKDIVWCNAHDPAWIEKTIKQLEEDK